jgi:hypothetical protein
MDERFRSERRRPEGVPALPPPWLAGGSTLRLPLSLRIGRRRRRKRLQDAVEESLVDRDERMLRLAPDDEETRLVQNLQVMGDRRLGEREQGADLATGKLAGHGEFLDHAKSLRLSEGLQDPNQHPVVHQGRRFVPSSPGMTSMPLG